MSPPSLQWSPHPFGRPAAYLHGAFKLGIGFALIADGLLEGQIAGIENEWLGLALSVLAVAVGAAALLFPGPRKRSGWRLGYVVALPVVALVAHFVVNRGILTPATALPVPIVPGAVALLAGLGSIAFGEWDRRRVRIELDETHLTVFVKRYRLEHELPFEEVREVDASRTLWGRFWGHGDFVARVKKGTMQDRVTKPVVGETPPDDATRGNGWDEEERYHLKAAWPYKKVRRALERRIVLARMSPKEREEQELAYRLKEDLQDLQA